MNPITSLFEETAARTIPRRQGFIPGASPPLHITPILMETSSLSLGGEMTGVERKNKTVLICLGESRGRDAFPGE
jgi:hypothetical protein